MLLLVFNYVFNWIHDSFLTFSGHMLFSALIGKCLKSFIWELARYDLIKYLRNNCGLI